MRTLLASVIALLFTIPTLAAECKLDASVRLDPATFDKTFPNKRSDFTSVRLDKIPKSLGEDITKWKNGSLIAQVGQIFTGAHRGEVATGFLGVYVGMPGQGSVGFANLYLGSHDLSGSMIQQNGFAVYTVEDSHSKIKAVTKVRAQRIESIELTLPIREIDAQGKAKLVGFETVCVLSMTGSI